MHLPFSPPHGHQQQRDGVALDTQRVDRFLQSAFGLGLTSHKEVFKVRRTRQLHRTYSP